MKTLSRLSFVYLLWGAALIICSCGPHPEHEPDPTVIPDTQATFSVSGLTCTSCEANIKARLKKHRGVTEVKAIFGTQPDNVEVTFDSRKTTIGALKATIEKNKKFQVYNTASRPL